MTATEHDEYSYSVFFVLTWLYYDIKSVAYRSCFLTILN